MNTGGILEVQNNPEFSVIRISGFIDAATVERIKPVVTAELSADCTNIVMDLEKVEFLDSHGIGFFVSLLKRVNARQGKLVFCSVCPQPVSVLNMVGFNNKLITYCDSFRQAQALLGKNGAA